MAVVQIPGTNQSYYLVSFDKHGEERRDDPAAPGRRTSDVVQEAAARPRVTDIFIMSHGWKGDVPAAIEQYNAWFGSMLKSERDQERMRRRPQGFDPLFVGLHWPSLPWGAERLDEAVSFSAPDGEISLLEEAADAIADSPAAREALNTIFGAAADDVAPARLPPDVTEAYRVLAHEAGLTGRGPDAPPGADAEPFDPQAWYSAAASEDAIAFGGLGLGGSLSVLRQMSFWKMKARALHIGDTGAADFLRSLRGSVAEGARFHLMGHSFGCIVVSAAVDGAGGADSMFLVQGALSLWSYCSDIPVAPGTEGCFHRIVSGRKVRGAIVTTQSDHDTAVGRLYPMAAGVAGQVSYAPDEPPKYGAVGTFGCRGPGLEIADVPMCRMDESYEFKAGQIYNVESSRVISEGGGLSGAHSDIAKPEVAHAFWEAALTAER